ncbi:MAG: nitrate/nitrite transporter [Actinomycetaceae bacterium]|nr:nitrate/nitrite transporter [Actinomycetaceae bacterium]
MNTKTLDTSTNPIQGWDPEDPEKWDSKIAWKTLWITTVSLTIAFCTWYMVSAIAPRLNDIGFDLSAAQLYWLAAIPGLAGGLLRLAYMFLPPIIGTRKMVAISTLLMLVPMVGWYFAIQNPATPFSVLLLLSFTTGIGGGVFSGYMPSTGYFFPKAKAGTALGIQAGIGNFGVSLIQLIGPWIIGFGLLGTTFLPAQETSYGPIHLHNIAIIMIPWAIATAVVAWWQLKDVPITANFAEQFDIFSNKNTWILTLVYLMTFGAFSGFAAQLALLINNVYGNNSVFAGQEGLPAGVTFAFLGPLIGSATRVLAGPLCDRFGGAIWTFIAGIGMTIGTAVATVFLRPTSPSEFWPFLWAMLAVFFFAGIGNAGTFKQMPMILPPRQAGGVIGWTAGIAAFGPFLVGVMLTAMSPFVFFIGCTVFFAACTVLTWIYYARPNAPFPG